MSTKVKSRSGASKTKKAKSFSITVDCSVPANDKIFDVAAYEKFLHDRIKIEGRTNNFGTQFSIVRSGNKVTLKSDKQLFPKRYVNFLTKKFLKKNTLRDWIRVNACNKRMYELKYFNIASPEEDEEDDEDDE